MLETLEIARKRGKVVWNLIGMILGFDREIRVKKFLKEKRNQAHTKRFLKNTQAMSIGRKQKAKLKGLSLHRYQQSSKQSIMNGQEKNDNNIKAKWVS